MTTNATPRPYRRTKATLLIIAAIIALQTPMASRAVRSPTFAEGRTPSLREVMLSTPRASDMKAGGHGDTGRMGSVRHIMQEAAAMLPTPLARDMQGGARYDPDGKRGISMREIMTPAALDRWQAQETLPTPTKRDKRDKRMDAWSPAYDKRKSPTMDAVLDGAMTDRAPDKWAYARQIAAMLTEAGMSGPSQTLPVTYGWMMGYPPGWLARALLSAMARGSLLPASSSRRSATR